MFQSWRELLFAHWPVGREVLRPLVPPALEVEEWEGRGWVGVAAFRLVGLRPRGSPALPGLSEFPELNLRTYVRYAGRPGIYFFSLDAGNRLAVAGARLGYRLPYRLARIRIEREGEWVVYRSRRADGRAEFVGRYRPVGAGFEPAPGTLEHFLIERYALYAVLRSGRVLRADIHHRPWQVRPAEARIERNTVASAAGIDLPDDEPLLHYAARQDTLVWPPRLED